MKKRLSHLLKNVINESIKIIFWIPCMDPFSIKDVIHAKHLKFTAGSKFYSNYVSNSTASIIKILNRKGAILIGTNNLNEFASGITGKNYVFGDSKNPWDLSRVSGGSSGGSTVAVAAGMVVFSLEQIQVVLSEFQPLFVA